MAEATPESGQVERPALAIGTVVLASASFATASPFARLARPADPFFVAFGRLALAGLLLWGLRPRGLLDDVRKLSPKARRDVALVGLILAAHFGLFLWGLDETSIPAAVSLVSLEPLSVVVFGWALHGIRPGRLEQIGVVTATAGAVFIAQAAGEGEHRLFGDVLVLGAVLLFGLYVAQARGLRDVLPARSYAAAVYLSAAVWLSPVVVGVFVFGDPPAIPAESFFWIGLLGLIPTFVGHTLVQSAARRLPPSVVGLVSPGETLGSIAIASIWLGEPPQADEWAGAIIILLGVSIAIVGASRRPSAAKPIDAAQ